MINLVIVVLFEAEVETDLKNGIDPKIEQA
jgi:hypothetical protein